MDKITLAAVGDIMLGDHPVCFGHGIRTILKAKGCGYLVSKAIRFLDGYDIVMGNIECVISEIDHDEDRLSTSELRAGEESIELLKMCGFNLLNVANNHMLQHGEDAFHDTVRQLKEYGIDSVGLEENGKSNIVTYEKNELTVSVVGYSLRPEQYQKQNKLYAQPDQEDIVEQISTLKGKYKNHSIVVNLHWGQEYLHVPSYQQIQLAHSMVDAGATLIVGHHPHVLQGIEKYKNGIVAYSLGNFLFDSWQKPTRESIIIIAEFGDRGLEELKIEPLFRKRSHELICGNKKYNKDIIEKLENYAKAITDTEEKGQADAAEYEKSAARVYLKYRIECYLYFCLNIWRYKKSVVVSSIKRAFLRRMGLA